jgi:hypothetical protein
MRLPEEGLGRGANRVTASHLAERAEWADILAGMQVRSPVARSTANTRRSLVVVKSFNREEMDFACERQAGNKYVHPVSVSRFAKPSQVDRSLLVDPDFLPPGSPRLRLILPKSPRNGERRMRPWHRKMPFPHSGLHPKDIHPSVPNLATDG